MNQTPEQVARDRIDKRLRASGWHVQDKAALDFNAGHGIAVREYQTEGAKNPKSSLSAFRNDYYPRIAVTVDMIATGTDVRPLECLIFMRDVKPKNYFEQMKGRGTRVLKPDDLKKVSPSAQAKTHYVIVDAVGVTRSLKTASQPLDTKPSIPFNDLAMGLSCATCSTPSSATTWTGRPSTARAAWGRCTRSSETAWMRS